MANEAEAVPVMQVINGTCKVTINVADLPLWEAKGFKPVLEAKKPAGKGKKTDAGKPAGDNETPEADQTEPEAGGEVDEKTE